MFEEMATSAMQLIVLMLWVMIACLVVYGAWWFRSLRYSKQD
jgi:hypothetical protein